MAMATLLKLYVSAVAIVSIVALVYVYAIPLQSMVVDRDGIAHFTPPVSHAETGEPVPLGELVRHFKGD